MSRRTNRWTALVTAIAVGAVALACGSGGVQPTDTVTEGPDPTATATATTEPAGPTQSPEPSPAASPTATPQTASAPSGTPAAQTYDPNEIMDDLLLGATRERSLLASTFDKIARQRDTSQVAVVMELMRFLPQPERDMGAAVLRELTGQDLNDWNVWMEWFGKHRSEFPPPDDYALWKATLLSRIHPRFGVFLGDAKETSRIDLTEVVWGGVAPDGIPDLRDPPTISPAQADYLNADDRVFGVSINGEHRAYPLRIVNPHEMANDVLGGEPISLVW